MNLTIRPAVIDDADALAAVFSPSIRSLGFLPDLHTPAEDRWFIEHVILAECAVSVAAEGTVVHGFLALQGSEIRLLYVHPERIGQGIGSRLMETVRNAGAERLELWCFQANWNARRFYERHRFIAVEFTDGRNNEEKTPDMRYVWTRPVSQPPA